MVAICTTSFESSKYLFSAHTESLCAVYGSQNKELLFPYPALNDRFFYTRDGLCLLRCTDWMFQHKLHCSYLYSSSLVQFRLPRIQDKPTAESAPFIYRVFFSRVSIGSS